MIGSGKRRIGARKPGIDFNGLPIHVLGGHVGLSRIPVECLLTSQEEFVSFQIWGVPLVDTMKLGIVDLAGEGCNDQPCHFVLNREDVSQVPIVLFAPYLTTGSRIYQVRGDPNSLLARPNTSLQQVSDA